MSTEFLILWYGIGIFCGGWGMTTIVIEDKEVKLTDVMIALLFTLGGIISLAIMILSLLDYDYTVWKFKKKS